MSFSASQLITTFSLKPNTVLPHDLHCSGTLCGVMKDSGNKLAFRIKAAVPNDTRNNDYVLSNETGTTKYTIDVYLQPLEGRASEEATRRQVVEETQHLTIMMGKTLKIDVGGLKVDVVNQDNPHMKVAKLEGSGNRLCALGEEEFFLVPALPAPSQTPAWFDTPPDTAPFAHRPSPPSPMALGQAGPSRLRPLTSLAVPNFEDILTNQRQQLDVQRKDSVNERASVPIKRAKSPETRVERSLEVKKARISDAELLPGPVIDENPDSIDDPDQNGLDNDPGADLTPIPPPNSTVPQSTTQPVSPSPQKPLKLSPPTSPRISRPAQLSDTVANQGESSRRPTRDRTPQAHRSHSNTSNNCDEDGTLKAEISTPAQRQKSIGLEAGTELSRQNSEAEVREAITIKSARQIAEEEVLVRRRSEAEAKARAEAEARRAEKEAEARRAEEDVESLSRSFVAGGIQYTPLKHVQDGPGRNIMGVLLEAKSTKSQVDWITTVIIADPTTHTDGHGSDDLAVSIFRKTQAELPIKVRRGTPILFRNIKIAPWRDKPKGNAYKPDGAGRDTNTWVILDKNGNVQIAEEANMLTPLTQGETDRLRALRRWWTAYERDQGDSGSGYIDEGALRQDSVLSDGGGGGKRGQVLLSEVRNRDFFTAVVKILHVVTNGNAGTNRPSFELYVTDGTVSPLVTRNWHNVSDPQIPASAIFTLAIFGQQPPQVAATFAPGNVVEFKNVRVNERQGLELKWSEKVTPEQVEDGWKTRKCYALDRQDDRVRVINTRINALKRGEQYVEPNRGRADPPPPPSAVPVPGPSAPAARSDQFSNIPVATHVGTTYKDDIEHPVSELSAVLDNTTVPNKFRVQARVLSLHARGTHGNPSFVQYHCTKCKRQFTTAYCLSCNDDGLVRAELRYRFIGILEQGEVNLPIVIADQEAEAFLPPLPPITKTNNENDHRKIQTRIKEACERVHEILMGAKMNGERSRPVIDWTLETFEVKQKKSGKEEVVVVVRAFGMRSG